MSEEQAIPQGPAPDDGPLRLFEKSLLQQAKLAEVAAVIGRVAVNQTWLSLDGGDGVISFHLRRLGGAWHSAAPDEQAAASIGRLVGGEVGRLQEGRLPHGDGMFDGVAVTDVLERVREDARLIAECHRVLKPTGRLVVHVPHLKKRGVLRPIRRLLRLRDAACVRPGYTEAALFDLLKDGFDVQATRTYSRFFVEALDTMIRLGSKIASRGRNSDPLEGEAEGRETRDMEKIIRRASWLYPVYQFAAGMDTLLAFTKGYNLLVHARRRVWRPRRAPVLTDGRSIVEATLGGKIGSAAPF